MVLYPGKPQSLLGASFSSDAQLRHHINNFPKAYNKNAKPFLWTKTNVHKRCFKDRLTSKS